MDIIKFPENLLTTCGLSILLHGVIELPGATSYDNIQLLTYVEVDIIQLLAYVEVYMECYLTVNVILIDAEWRSI